MGDVLEQISVTCCDKGNYVLLNCTTVEVAFDKCAKNLEHRLNVINEHIIGLDKNDTPFEHWFDAEISSINAKSLCLCGHAITHVHLLKKDKWVIQLGSKCIDKFIPSLSEKAHKSLNLLLRKTFTCERCGKERVKKEKSCVCELLSHCVLCDKPVKDNFNYCKTCEKPKECQQCKKMFNVNARLFFFKSLCDECA
jgi:hypothetical protein